MAMQLFESKRAPTRLSEVVTTGGDRTPGAAETQLWNVVTGAATDSAEFYRAWLALQCGMIAGTTAGLLLLRQPTGAASFAAVAAWPDAGQDLSHLQPIAMQAAEQRRSIAAWGRNEGAVVQHSLASAVIAHPVGSGPDGPAAVVAVVVAPRAGSVDPQAVARQLHWGGAWLNMSLVRRLAEDSAERAGLAAASLDVLAVAGEHKRLANTAMAIVNELAERLGCERVSIGLATRRNSAIRIHAMSRSAVLKRKAQLVSVIENAMEEAFDQNAAVAYPSVPATERRIAVAHKELAKVTGSRAVVLSVIVPSAGRPIGAITLERHRDEPFAADAPRLCEAVAALVGPLLDVQRDADRWVSGRLLDGAGDGLRALFGPRHPTVKLAAIGIVFLVAILAFARGENRVSAKAVTEGVIQRAAVAPFEGFIKRAAVRAGDIVHEGDLLAALDDRDLMLDRLRQQSEWEKLSQKHRDALAKHDRAEMVALAAQVEQAAAQLKLATDKLGRSRITAPFDGVVVSGDLSQMLGSPVEKGKALFEIAPLDQYRVILQVDERDIRYVRAGESGRIALTGSPARPIPFRIVKVMPVTSSEEGRNFFRVEAQLEPSDAPLRPGMEGVAKIDAGQQRLIWVWTRPFVDWLRVFLWKWLP
jgi:RND family efflux transporter MFP subunit